MNYVVLNRGDEISQQLTAQFHELAAAKGMTESGSEPDIVISIGGDGTMLHAFHQFTDKLDNVAFVGVHTGHLGFYADWKASELEQLTSLMSEAGTGTSLAPRIVKYPIVEIVLETSKKTETFLALNEFTLKGPEATLVAQVSINDEPFESFRGDGICISTPPGSTAYNKSLGGAILHPSLEALQMAEIASINNRVFRTIGSPIILPKHHHIDIVPREGQNLLLTLDHKFIEVSDAVCIRSRVADQKVSFVRYRSYPFWNRVRDAFVNGENGM